mgnify:FL=1|jgi:hypothetical protein|tara:strand:- start:1240 stop:1515 length:276 start_codon:yes stop_codon:yes gene_type:complete
MAKRKTEKVVDLKPTNITDEQLKSIQDIVSPINNAQVEIGRIESRKHMLCHDIAMLQEKLQVIQKELEEQYGTVNVNIQTGEINYDVEANS